MERLQLVPKGRCRPLPEGLCRNCPQRTKDSPMGSAVSDKTSQPSASEPNQVSPSSSTSSRGFHSGAMAVAISATKSPWALANRRQRDRDPFTRIRHRPLLPGPSRYAVAVQAWPERLPSPEARTEIDASMARALHVVFALHHICLPAGSRGREGVVRTGHRYENTFAAS